MQEKEKEKILGMERNVFFTGLTSFFTDTSTKMVYSVMPLFLMSIGASKTAIALIEGIAESTASLIKALSGYWSDKVGKNKPFMLTGYSVFTGLFAMYGLYSALVDGSQKAMISDITSKELRGTGFGIYHAVLGITLLPASLIAGLLYDKASSAAPFYFGSAMALTATALMVVFAIFNKRTLNVKKIKYDFR